MTDKKLIDIQNNLLTTAQDGLTKGVFKYQRQTGYIISDESNFVTIIDMEPTDEQILEFIATKTETTSLLRSLIENVVCDRKVDTSTATSLVLDDILKHVLRKNRNDIIAEEVKNICNIKKASAFFHIYLECLADDKSIEVLGVFLECPNYRRQIHTEITREPPSDGGSRDRGKIIGFGGIKEIIEDGIGKPKILTGRYTNMINNDNN